MDWIQLAQDRVEWFFFGHGKSGTLRGWVLTSWTTVSLSRRTLLHGVSSAD